MWSSRRGIGLVEVIIAVGLFVTLAAGIVPLFSLSARSLAGARHRTSSLILAVDKLEQLRATVPTPGAGQTEYLDTNGRLIGIGRTPPSDTVYVRVWTAGSRPGLGGVSVVRVTVAPVHSGDGGGRQEPDVAPDGARLVTLLGVGS
ncbi:MAG: hypothetical protein QF681_16090 [Vicinamibacterales bacterium]|jgi:type II secretory pathway pseudopilin PulG|nr:hypothetical protein [Vicinamibacterales bacterium]